MDLLLESELPRQDGKRAQTLTAPTTQSSPDAQCHNNGPDAEPGHHAQMIRFHWSYPCFR